MEFWPFIGTKKLETMKIFCINLPIAYFRWYQFIPIIMHGGEHGTIGMMIFIHNGHINSFLPWPSWFQVCWSLLRWIEENRLNHFHSLLLERLHFFISLHQHLINFFAMYFNLMEKCIRYSFGKLFLPPVFPVTDGIICNFRFYETFSSWLQIVFKCSWFGVSYEVLQNEREAL